MPIGSTYVYNSGDLILSTVSGSGTSFIETKIAAATSSLILFNNNGTLTSASLNSITVGTASYVSGSTSIITNLTASNISVSSTGSFGIVGIGTSSPAAKLDVSANAVDIAIFRSSGGLANDKRLTITSGGEKVIFNVSDNSNTAIARVYEFQNAGTASMTINVSGSVGIGTTSPVAKLQVVGNISGSSFTSSISNAVGFLGTSSWAQNVVSASFALTSSYINPSGNAFVQGGNSFGTTATFGTNDASALVFETSGSTRMTLDTNGNVGIGTSSPTAKFDVRPDSSWLGSEAVIIDTDGGNNPRIKLYRPDGGSPTSSYAIHLRNDSGNLNILNTGVNAALGSETVTSKFYITTVGNVGIGTTNPTARLHVSGSTIISGSLNVTANITCLSLTETSTEAVKYNILPLPSQLDNVLKLKPVSFNYKANDKHSIGLIAEEVAKIYPEFTSDNNDSISYGKITSVLIQSIKELKTIIDNQQKQIENLIDKLK